MPAVGLEPTRPHGQQMKKPIKNGENGPAAKQLRMPLVPWGHRLTKRKYNDNKCNIKDGSY